MQGVSSRIFTLILEGLERPVRIDRLVEGLDVDEARFHDRHAHVAWEDFTVIVERLGKEIGGDEELRKLGTRAYRTQSFRAFRLLGRALLSPQDVYYFGAQWLGPRMFPMFRAETFEPAADHVVQRLSLEAGHRDCPSVFYLFQGAMETIPVAFGFARSRVELTIEPGRATFQVFPQQSQKSRIGRFVRMLRAPFTMPRMLNELFEQQLVNESNYKENRRARDRIEKQAADLERVNSIGRRLSQKIDLEYVTDELVRVMLEELGTAGVELRLIPPSSDPPTAEKPGILPAAEVSGTERPRFYHKGGTQIGKPSGHYLLETAARPVGTLTVWMYDEGPERNRHAMITRLLPWISMSLDNARSYEVLQNHASELEQRVKDRTSRLLSANHHLVKEIGERKKATEALLESEAQRRAAERLASIGTLAAGIAHEINNPIGSILAAAQFALLNSQDDPEAPNRDLTAVLDDIVTQAKRCGGIVRSVLQFSRDERTEKWNCNIPESILRGARLADRLAAERGAIITTAIPQVDLWSRANPIQIEQAVVNLVRNAIEADARNIRIEASIEHEPNQIRIEISDDGTGIADKERDRIFEPFYTTKREDGGTGLGLSVVHGIVEEHGGLLDVGTTDQGQTRVRLTLPIQFETETELIPVPSAAQSPATETPKLPGLGTVPGRLPGSG